MDLFPCARYLYANRILASVEVAGTDRAFVKGLGELLRDAAASFATTRASRWLPRWSLLLAVAAALPPAAGPGVAVVVPPALTAAREPRIAVGRASCGWEPPLMNRATPPPTPEAKRLPQIGVVKNQ